jgi:hypothetical protein
VSDIDTVVVDSLKALDPEWPIREADMRAITSMRPLCAIAGPFAVQQRPLYSMLLVGAGLPAGAAVIMIVGRCVRS